jgi:hypothetical protein
MQFLLKDGTGIDERHFSTPPFIVKFEIPLDHVPTLRDHASLLLRAFGGDAQRFLASILEAGTLEQPGIREAVACALVAMATDTPGRLIAVLSGKAKMAGFVVTRDRMREISAARQQVRTIRGSGMAMSPAAAPKWVFRYWYR